jgi:arsenate reductase
MISNLRIARRRLIAALVATAALAVGVRADMQQDVAPPKAPTVLFMCPHGAAKSVLASAYFLRLAKERGLAVHVLSAGTDPDPQVAPAVANHLTKNGYDVPVAKPRRVTDTEMSTADVVISIGCNLSDLPAPRGALMKWDDVPALSEHFERADERIRQRVIQLVDELVRRQQR